MRTFVARRRSSRLPEIASPSISSERPSEYMSAVSKRLIPTSRHMSTWRLAPSTSVEPSLLKLPCPPKVMVPRVRLDTNKPERPSCQYCTQFLLDSWYTVGLIIVAAIHDQSIQCNQAGGGRFILPIDSYGPHQGAR